MPEKLLTIKELAQYLDRPEKEIIELAESGIIPAYKIGGSFLRFRKEQVDAIKDEIPVNPPPEQIGAKPKTNVIHTEISLPNKIIKESKPEIEATFMETVQDFIYFNDFYIVSFSIIGVLLFFIFKM